MPSSAPLLPSPIMMAIRSCHSPDAIIANSIDATANKFASPCVLRLDSAVIRITLRRSVSLTWLSGRLPLPGEIDEEDARRFTRSCDDYCDLGWDCDGCVRLVARRMGT